MTSYSPASWPAESVDADESSATRKCLKIRKVTSSAELRPVKLRSIPHPHSVGRMVLSAPPQNCPIGKCVRFHRRM